jgi:aminoglycoside phosphotransferase (APT) family kinase protein
MIRIWKGYLLDKAAEWGLPAGGDWTFVVQNNYQPQCSNLNVMWFHNAGEFPRVVVKFCSDPEPLEREFANMRRVHQAAPTVVPTPLHFGPHEHLWGLWMEGVPGSVLTPAEAGAPDVVRSMGEMVASLHSAVRRGQQEISPDRFRQMAEAPLQAVAQFGSSEAVKTGCCQIAAAISPKWLNSLPAVPQHGDLYSGNILSHRDRRYVVDWESFGAIDLPFYDLLTLLISLLRDSGKTPAAWNPNLLKQVAPVVRSYAQKLELDAADVSNMLPLAFVNWFYLHLKDRRKAFTESMYGTIQQYFESPEPWQRAFLSQ